jgi:hypothetical protein
MNKLRADDSYGILATIQFRILVFVSYVKTEIQNYNFICFCKCETWSLALTE